MERCVCGHLKSWHMEDGEGACAALCCRLPCICGYVPAHLTTHESGYYPSDPSGKKV